MASRATNPGRYRILLGPPTGRRRLFNNGDPYHPDREGSKTTPAVEDLPESHRELLDWYKNWTRDSLAERIKNDPLLNARGSGKLIWADEHADEYVRRLREGWE